MKQKDKNILIAGARGHAKEVLCVLEEEDKYSEVVFFDDTKSQKQPVLYGQFRILTTLEAAKEFFKENNEFIIGNGGCATRQKISDKLREAGGQAITIIAKTTTIGNYGVQLGGGLNIMPYVFISNSVEIGEGTLLNTRCSVHHDAVVGQYCDIAPGATLLGGVTVGDFTHVGANATILPNVSVGSHCKIGAGAVVTKNVGDGKLVKGVPSK